MIHRIVVVAALNALCACAKSETPAADTAARTKAQRDSAIGQSGLPGAGGVMKAMSAADSARARQAALDSIARP